MNSTNLFLHPFSSRPPSLAPLTSSPRSAYTQLIQNLSFSRRSRCRSPVKASAGNNREETHSASGHAKNSDPKNEVQQNEFQGFEPQKNAQPYSIIAAMTTQFSNIAVLEFQENTGHPLQGSRVMLLDESGNICSMHYRDKVWTDSYWDELSAFVPLLPPMGPIGILGFAGGTVAKVIRNVWPRLGIEAWEIDPVVVDMAREYFDVSSLEPPSPEGGYLNIHVGDAFGDDVTTPGGFAGLIIDLSSNGVIHPALQESETWKKMKSKLRSGGRIMVNCGGPSRDPNDPDDPGLISARRVLNMISQEFTEGFSARLSLGSDEMNFLALTGRRVDTGEWGNLLPEHLRAGIGEWKFSEIP